MIILKAKYQISQKTIDDKERELSDKLRDEVVIIPEVFEIVTLNHIDEYIELDEEDLI
ncbi:MAG: hypothetical protein RSC84_03200 [Peptostreptococcaceae bacterium]